MNARIRLRRAGSYPSLDSDRWYPVIREEHRGLVLQLDDRELLVSYADVQTKE